MNCPRCGAVLESAGDLDHFRCTRCGTTYRPAESGDDVTVEGEPVGALCPLCGEPLVSAWVEDEFVCYCGRCRGFLAENETFAVIVAKRRARHAPGEHSTEPFDPAELRRELDCPNCHSR